MHGGRDENCRNCSCIDGSDPPSRCGDSPPWSPRGAEEDAMRTKTNKQLTPLAKNLRKDMTKEERKLWYEFLQGYPVRFYRQKV